MFQKLKDIGLLLCQSRLLRRCQIRHHQRRRPHRYFHFLHQVQKMTNPYPLHHRRHFRHLQLKLHNIHPHPHLHELLQNYLLKMKLRFHHSRPSYSHRQRYLPGPHHRRRRRYRGCHTH
jgi:hypothetical protein